MRSLASLDSFKVGLVAIVVTGLLGLGVLGLSVLSLDTKTYTAELAQTAGLRKGEEVSVHGVTAGEVTGIELAGEKVRVRFRLDRGIHLGSETSAKIKVATLLGTHMLAVSPKGSGDLPKNTIPLSRTSVPFNLQDVLEKGTEAVDQLDAETIAHALTEMSKTMDASGSQIGPALLGITQLSEAVATRTSQTGELISAARLVTDQLSRSSGDLVVLMKQANLVLNEVTSRREAIHRLLTETTELSRNLTAVMNATKADLGPAFARLNQVVGILRAEDASLKQLVKTGAAAVRFVANATGNGPWAELWTMPPALPPDDVCSGPLKPVIGLACVQ